MAFMALVLTMPVDRGKNYAQYTENTTNLFFLLNAYSYWLPLMTSCTLQIYIHVFVHYYIYKDEITADHILALIGRCFYQSIALMIGHIFITWIGKQYLRAEVLRSGNDKLLNNLEEGVVVIDETKDKIRFINEAGELILKSIEFHSTSKNT